MRRAPRCQFRRLAAAIFLTFGTMTCASAQFQCPTGSRPVSGGGGMMCQCPDGSFAGLYTGCRQQIKPQPRIPAGSVHCSTGYCPAGTKCGSGGKCLPSNGVDCGNGRACASGAKCSAGGGCVPEHTVDCGEGKYCNEGMVCVGTTQCITNEEAVRRQLIAKTKQMLSTFGVKDGFLLKDAELRHKRAVQYVLDNPEVQSALRDLIVVRGSAAAYGPAGEKAASVVLNLKAALEGMNEFKNGQYYQGSLHVTNQASSILLEALPYKGPSSDILNLSGAVTTAYVYGFFWGN